MPVVYLIPTFLDEAAIHTIPPYVKEAVKECQVFFVENERSARRYLKALWREMVIDDYEWHPIHKAEEAIAQVFRQRIKDGKNIGIISEAGCPGVADPGQVLTAVAHDAGATVKPLTGPSSILLALMASGMNGQQFQFVGYLPIDHGERNRQLKELESYSRKFRCSQIFIETPYRNHQLIETMLKNLQGSTRLCIAVDITGPEEWIRTLTVEQWKRNSPDIHKRPAIFIILAA